MRIISDINFNQLIDILKIINSTSINYTEIHLTYSKIVNEKRLFLIIEKFAIVSHIYVYSSPKNEIVEFNINKEKYYKLLLGTLYLDIYRLLLFPTILFLLFCLLFIC